MLAGIAALLHDLVGSARIAGSPGSCFRLAADFIRRRFLPLLPASSMNRPREVTLRDGMKLHYRFNRGDLQGLREVWMDGAYRPPFKCHPKIVVDLGANIGLTSTWLHHHYQCERLIAVEPDPDNAAIVRRNFERNAIPGEVIEAAVGPTDGRVSFARSDASNIGQVVTPGAAEAMHGTGLEVAMISRWTSRAERGPCLTGTSSGWTGWKPS